jgi:hypothetical protein
MNRIPDEEQWALGRDAIEREKSAARAWLARRDGPVAPIAHARKLRFWVWRRIRWITATCTVLVLAAVLLVRWEGASRPPKGVGPASAFLMVLKSALEADPALAIENVQFEPAGMTGFAWSIQQVLCRARLTDETFGALAPLIENAFLKARAEEEPRGRPVLMESFRSSRFSLHFSQVYKSIREG